MAIDVVLTHGNSFNCNVIVELYLLAFLVCNKKIFFSCKNTLQLFLLFSTMFYNQDVVQNVVAKGGVFY